MSCAVEISQLKDKKPQIKIKEEQFCEKGIAILIFGIIQKSSLHWLIPRSFLFIFVQWSVIARIKFSADDVRLTRSSSNTPNNLGFNHRSYPKLADGSIHTYIHRSKKLGKFLYQIFTQLEPLAGCYEICHTNFIYN